MIRASLEAHRAAEAAEMAKPLITDEDRDREWAESRTEAEERVGADSPVLREWQEVLYEERIERLLNHRKWERQMWRAS